MDVSDGLLTDLQKLCAASRCGARLDHRCAAAHLRRCASCSTRTTAIDYALAGGDDYELIFTLPPDRAADAAGAPRSGSAADQHRSHHRGQRRAVRAARRAVHAAAHRLRSLRRRRVVMSAQTAAAEWSADPRADARPDSSARVRLRLGPRAARAGHFRDAGRGADRAGRDAIRLRGAPGLRHRRDRWPASGCAGRARAGSGCTIIQGSSGTRSRDIP